MVRHRQLLLAIKKKKIKIYPMPFTLRTSGVHIKKVEINNRYIEKKFLSLFNSKIQINF